MLSGERMETAETGTDERRAVLVALRKRLKVPQALIEKRAKIDHSRFSKWKCGYVELSEIELLKISHACHANDRSQRRGSYVPEAGNVG